MVRMAITNDMYSKLPNLVLGFHGCNAKTYENVMDKHEFLRPSTNSYDWLGNGIYFWENSYERALEWSKSKYKDDGRVIGAILDLGYCLNLTDYRSADILKQGYIALKESIDILGLEMPSNSKGKSKVDVLQRNLDCAVIEQIHRINEYDGKDAFDSVRGVFTEGEAVYPGAAVLEKTHIQICVINPNCIKGFFYPMELNEEYRIP